MASACDAERECGEVLAAWPTGAAIGGEAVGGGRTEGLGLWIRRGRETEGERERGKINRLKF